MIPVFKVRMHDGVAARTDGENIFIDDRLDEIQAKCAITHELVHIERGHSAVQPESIEMAVRYETARRLLPLDEIVGVCKNGKSLKMIARELGVTRQVLMDRAATLTEPQMQIAGCFTCRLCPIVNARYPEARGVRGVRQAAYAS